jgi:hypothetical protein
VGKPFTENIRVLGKKLKIAKTGLGQRLFAYTVKMFAKVKAQHRKHSNLEVIRKQFHSLAYDL